MLSTHLSERAVAWILVQLLLQPLDDTKASIREDNVYTLNQFFHRFMGEGCDDATKIKVCAKWSASSLQESLHVLNRLLRGSVRFY